MTQRTAQNIHTAT